LTSFGIFVSSDSRCLWSNVTSFISIYKEPETVEEVTNLNYLVGSSSSTGIAVIRQSVSVIAPRRIIRTSRERLSSFTGDNELQWISYIRREPFKSAIEDVLKFFRGNVGENYELVKITTDSSLSHKWIALSALVLGELQVRMSGRRISSNEKLLPKHNYTATLFGLFCLKLGWIQLRVEAVRNWPKRLSYYCITLPFHRYGNENEEVMAESYKACFSLAGSLEEYIQRNWDIGMDVVRSQLS
jgi:hypothetical protein